MVACFLNGEIHLGKWELMWIDRNAWNFDSQVSKNKEDARSSFWSIWNILQPQLLCIVWCIVGWLCWCFAKMEPLESFLFSIPSNFSYIILRCYIWFTYVYIYVIFVFFVCVFTMMFAWSSKNKSMSGKRLSYPVPMFQWAVNLTNKEIGHQGNQYDSRFCCAKTESSSA